jgi:nucleoside-diphosphate-sugar epimerase
MLDGHDVLCLSRDPKRVSRQPLVRATMADLTVGGNWSDVVKAFGPEWCFHLAWEGLPNYSLQCCRVNLDASLRLLDAVSAAGVSKIVVSGSCWEYGRLSGAVLEDTAPGELGVFAATKNALRGVLDSTARHAGFTYRWARLFFVYGPGQRPTSLIPHLQTAYARGRPPEIRQPAAVQDFVHVDDVASALIALAHCDAPSGIFNVGSGEPTSVGHVANCAADYYGAVRPFPTPPRGEGIWADMTKTVASTGWRPRIGIDEGVVRTLAALGEVA